MIIIIIIIIIMMNWHIYAMKYIGQVRVGYKAFPV